MTFRHTLHFHCDLTRPTRTHRIFIGMTANCWLQRTLLFPSCHHVDFSDVDCRRSPHRLRTPGAHKGSSVNFHKLVQVSRVFYQVFQHYLYRDLFINIGDPRLAGLVKTLQANPNLRNEIQSLKIRLPTTIPKAPPLYRRAFPPTDQFLPFARLIIEVSRP